MKRSLFFILYLLLSIALFAQEPGNNLRKTVQELRRSFPDLIEWGDYGGGPNYKSPKAGILFGTKNGIVIREFTTFEGDNNYLKDLYNALTNSFRKNAKNALWSESSYAVTFFYSYFYVYISYTPNDDVSISYTLNQY